VGVSAGGSVGVGSGSGVGSSVGVGVGSGVGVAVGSGVGVGVAVGSGVGVGVAVGSGVGVGVAVGSSVGVGVGVAVGSSVGIGVGVAVGVVVGGHVRTGVGAMVGSAVPPGVGHGSSPWDGAGDGVGDAVGPPKGGGVTTIPGIPFTGPGGPGGRAHGVTLPDPGAACADGLASRGGAEAALPGAQSLIGTSIGDGSPAGCASAGACARFGDAPKAATVTAATMIHAADAATPIRPVRRRGWVVPWTGAATATVAASGPSRAPPDVRVGRGRAASGGVLARGAAYGSAARLASPPAGPGAMTIRRWPGASTSRNGAHFRQAPSTRFQQSAQQAAPQVGQLR
jgi:hypothetical protein